MKRLILIALVVLLLTGIGVVVWTVAGLPPVHMVWRYGFSYGPQPTGRTLTVETLEFVEIGPGCFLMGSEKNATGGDLLGKWCARFALPWGNQPEPSDEMPVHWVEFQRGFWMAKTEVSNEQYERFNPEHERGRPLAGDRDPVVYVSWWDATEYCAWLSKQSGQYIRLPGESEWECACRAGSDREFCFGDDEKRLGEYAWFVENSDRGTHEVGTRRANAWGLYDFHGNVLEWCGDTHRENYDGAPADGTAWTDGGVEWEPGSPGRVMRGGYYGMWAKFCRSAVRGASGPWGRARFLGFRPAFRRSED